MTPPGTGVEVRDTTAVDLPLLGALHMACFKDGLGGEVWSEAAIGRILALPGAFGLLAIAEAPAGAEPSAPAGFLLARTVVSDVEVLSLGVPTPWRGKGVARALLSAALHRARGLGAERVLLEAAEDNAAACALYAAEGFAVIGRRPAYYRRPPGPAVTALVFARSLAESGRAGAGGAKSGPASARRG